jgi:hypothetical protein
MEKNGLYKVQYRYAWSVRWRNVRERNGKIYKTRIEQCAHDMVKLLQKEWGDWVEVWQG